MHVVDLADIRVTAGAYGQDDVAVTVDATAAATVRPVIAQAPADTPLPAGTKSQLFGITWDSPPLVCPSSSKVLLPASSGGYLPTNWDSFTVQQQAQSPLMIIFHQLAVIANSPKEAAFAKCVAPWGVVSGSTKQVQQKFAYQGEQSINSAYVFAAGKNLFITIR